MTNAKGSWKDYSFNQIAVCVLLAKGLKNKEIAEILEESQNYVANVKRRHFKHLGSHRNITQMKKWFEIILLDGIDRVLTDV